MKTVLITLTLLLSPSIMANDKPLQPAQIPQPIAMDIPMQTIPQQNGNDTAIPVISPEMLRLLMRQAEQQAGQETRQAHEDTSNARINNTQR